MALAARLVSDLRMASDNSALVLLHGILMSGNASQDVVPLLSNHHQVYTPTAAGHRGGPPVPRRPATVSDLVDAAERYLDERGLERPHLAGLSLGGWIAIELARRGRAATVCALAPAGFWSTGDSAQTQVNNQVRKFVTMGRFARPVPSRCRARDEVVDCPSARLSRPALATRTDLLRHRALSFLTTSSAAPSTSTTLSGPVIRSHRCIPCHARSLSHGWRTTRSFRSRRATRSPASGYPRRHSQSCPASGTTP